MANRFARDIWQHCTSSCNSSASSSSRPPSRAFMPFCATNVARDGIAVLLGRCNSSRRRPTSRQSCGHFGSIVYLSALLNQPSAANTIRPKINANLGRHPGLRQHVCCLFKLHAGLMYESMHSCFCVLLFGTSHEQQRDEVVVACIVARTKRKVLLLVMIIATSEMVRLSHALTCGNRYAPEFQHRAT